MLNGGCKGKAFRIGPKQHFVVRGIENGDLMADIYDNDGTNRGEYVPFMLHHHLNDENIPKFNRPQKKPFIITRMLNWTFRNTIGRYLPPEWSRQGYFGSDE
jgi:hypothetical protein